MKATGEVMAIDRSFEARAAEGGALARDRPPTTCVWEDPDWADDERLERLIRAPNDLRLWALMAALRRGETRRCDSPRRVEHRPLVPAQAAGHRATASRSCCSAELDARRCSGAPSGSASPTRRSRTLVGRDARPPCASARDARGMSPGLQDGRHLRRRVRGRDALLLQHLRRRERSAAAAGRARRS